MQGRTRILNFLQRVPAVPVDVITNTDGTLPDTGHPGLHPADRFDPTPEEEFRRLKSAIYRQGTLRDAIGLAGQTAVRVLEDDVSRSYFFVQNQSATATLVVRFGAVPSIGSGGQFVGVAIAANFGFWEPILVPTQECWIIASAAGTPYSIVFGQ